MTKTGPKGEGRSPGKKPAKEAPKCAQEEAPKPPTEHGGPKGPEPTRYGDWQRKGITSDF
jgi:hypothetical protein